MRCVVLGCLAGGLITERLQSAGVEWVARDLVTEFSTLRVDLLQTVRI